MTDWLTNIFAAIGEFAVAMNGGLPPRDAPKLILTNRGEQIVCQDVATTTRFDVTQCSYGTSYLLVPSPNGAIPATRRDFELMLFNTENAVR